MLNMSFNHLPSFSSIEPLNNITIHSILATYCSTVQTPLQLICTVVAPLRTFAALPHYYTKTTHYSKMAESSTEQSSAIPTTKEYYMGLALAAASKALENSEIPVGCVFVNPTTKKVIAVGSNKTNETRNGTRHAEMVAIDSALAKGISFKEFQGAELFVTCEPCIMCAAAISKMGISRVVFGCHNDRFGGNGSILNVHSDDCLAEGNTYTVEAGLMRDEAIEVFQNFYTTENRRGTLCLKGILGIQDIQGILVSQGITKLV